MSRNKKRQLSNDLYHTIIRRDALISALESDTQSGFDAEAALVEIGASAVDALIEATKHPNLIVRYRAVWALGKIRDGRAFEEILALNQDDSAEVRYDSILAQGE